MNHMGDLDFSQAESNPDQAEIERIHGELSAALA